MYTLPLNRVMFAGFGFEGEIAGGGPVSIKALMLELTSARV